MDLSRFVFLIGLLTGTMFGFSDSGSSFGRYPLSPVDRRIDDLGEERRIHSESDVREYIDALLSKIALDQSKSRLLQPFKKRLIRAEFSSVLDSEKRIPESVVVSTFNKLMDSWNAPPTNRISFQEFRLFRTVISHTHLPRTIERASDGTPVSLCRPAEALYLIFLLQSQGGVSLELRDAAKSGLQPNNLVKSASLESTNPTQLSLRLGKAPQGMVAYSRAVEAHFSGKSEVEVVGELEVVLQQLGI